MNAEALMSGRQQTLDRCERRRLDDVDHDRRTRRVRPGAVIHSVVPTRASVAPCSTLHTRVGEGRGASPFLPPQARLRGRQGGGSVIPASVPAVPTRSP
jgi:hypothetical protein